MAVTRWIRPGFASVAVASMFVLSACTGLNGAGVGNEPTRDADNDGIADNVDRCPAQPETQNGVFDRDGCPDVPRDLYMAVLTDVEGFWNLYFTSTLFRPYVRASGLRFFSGAVSTPCGSGRGPFYCPADFGVYLDEPFMESQLSRIGDFAPAVIIAHEVGHHTQHILGVSNPFTIQKELQADCLAGGWAASAGARGLLDATDLQEAARSLFEAGDPAGTPWFSPGAHGTPAQRQQAFTTGFTRGAFNCG